MGLLIIAGLIAIGCIVGTVIAVRSCVKKQTQLTQLEYSSLSMRNIEDDQVAPPDKELIPFDQIIGKVSEFAVDDVITTAAVLKMWVAEHLEKESRRLFEKSRRESVERAMTLREQERQAEARQAEPTESVDTSTPPMFLGNWGIGLTTLNN